jgi:hypothetical protein
LTNARAVANRYGVAGLGQDRGRANRGQASDRGDQLGQPELVKDAGHPLLGVAQPAVGFQPVAQQQRYPLQGTWAVRGHAGVVGQGREQQPDDAQGTIAACRDG